MQAVEYIRDYATGDATGVRMPAHPEALREAGAEFLTRAFRAFGSLPVDNAVERIVDIAPCTAGNSGQKVFLTVEYARPDQSLHTDLFVKFSREFTDAFRDRRRAELKGEVELALLSRDPAFPVTVAKPYFADFEDATGSGVLITEAIAFGRDGIEPLLRKCMDHELPNPIEHYRATVAALASLAAAQKSGRLAVDAHFPYDRAAAEADMPIPWSKAELRDKARTIGKFIAECPALFSPRLRDPAFAAQLEIDAVRFLANDAPIRTFLYGDPNYVALAHWNTNIDNAWFWRDAAGALQCGLLDWGMVRQMNLCYGIWGGLSAADPPVLEREIGNLLTLFADELAKNGGPRLDRAELDLHFDLSVMLLCLALMMDVTAIVLPRVPNIAEATSLHDPILQANQVAHGFLHVFSNALNLWAQRDFGASLDRVLG
jgi:hypothetical protein